MEFKSWLRKKRKIWHKHFLPSLGAALIVALISLGVKATTSNVLLFASLGASAYILTNKERHHLTVLRTILISYIIAAIISSIVYTINLFIPLHLSINLFILVLTVGLALYLFNVVHPPAVSASLAFILFERAYNDIIVLLGCIIILFIAVRTIIYLKSHHFSIKEFMEDFRKQE